MVQISDTRIGGALAFAPLPPLMTPKELLADALPVLDPPSRMSVTDAAERYVRVQVQGAWQTFDRGVTPYMVEPTDTTQSRLFKAVAFMGPSQSGKTKMLETVAFHAVTCDQRATLIIHMNRGKRDEWVEEKLDPSIQNSPALSDRLGRARDDSTFSRKRFRGMRLTLGYPTPQILSGGTYGMVLLTDLDHMPLVLGPKDNPEGSPFRMAVQRVKSYLSRGVVLAEGSPAFQVTDLGWVVHADAPHEMPPVDGGIARLYNQGTRARWYWECPDCGDEFEPRFDRLHYDDGLDPTEAGEQAEMECPHCHSLISHHHKMELNRAALHGRGGWRHEGQNGQVVALGDSGIRRSPIASYALNGVAATFSSWRDMVSNYEEAKAKAESLGDETELMGVMFTEIGLPYRRITTDDDNTLNGQYLKDHALDCPRGIAPEWTRFVTVSVDVQNGYFPVQTTAWGEDGQCMVIDRVDLTQPPMDAPNAEVDGEGNRRRLDPSRYIEDWAVLKPYANKIIPVAGQGYGLRPIGAVVDFQGQPGVSDNAELFWKARKADGQGGLWFLSRGQGGWKVPYRVKYEAPERGSRGKKARSIKLLTMATDRLKDTVHAALRKAAGGTGGMYLPEWLSANTEMADEFIAEERGSKGWDKKQGVVRNEGLDLSVQARALAEHKGLLRIKWDAPPSWAVGGPENINAVAIARDDGAPVAENSTDEGDKPATPEAEKAGWITKRDGWL